MPTHPVPRRLATALAAAALVVAPATASAATHDAPWGPVRTTAPAPGALAATRPAPATRAPVAGTTAGTAAGGAAAAAPTSPAVPQVGTWRLAGADRYATAVAISRSANPGPVPAVVVASGQNTVDAIAAAPVAAALKAPVVLVPPTGPLPADVAAELTRLAPRRLVVAATETSLSPAVVTRLTDLTHASFVRAAGTDRYETAAALAAVVPATPGGTVVVAGGVAEPEALAAGAAAGVAGGRLLLTRPGSLPDAARAALDRLAPRRVLVVGGTGLVSEKVRAAVAARLPGALVQRVGGPDPYATAVQLSKAVATTADRAYVASGESVTDALAGAAAAGGTRRPLLLVHRDCVPSAVLDEVDRLRARTVYILGGSGVLDVPVEYGIPC